MEGDDKKEGAKCVINTGQRVMSLTWEGNHEAMVIYIYIIHGYMDII